jgi:hypothetical protein
MKINLKSILFCGLLAASLNSFAQQRAVTLDPKLGALKMTDLVGNEINENFIKPGQLIKLVIPVTSVNQTDILPKGTCKVKISLGSKLALDPLMDLNALNSSNYFTWSATNSGGQSQITGDLNTSIPANFQQIEVAFKVIGNQLGHSTITANFLITNHNTNIILSDNDANNNGAFLSYEITNVAAPTPVTVINELFNSNCSLKLAFSTDRELDLKNYEVEISKNGIDFLKVYNVNATNIATYNTSISLTSDMQSPVLYVRVKSITYTGKIVYSEAKTVSGICTKNWVVSLYPNPVKANDEVTIKAISGSFNGIYNIVLMDIKGSVVDTKRIELNNVWNFKFKVANLAASKYTLRINNLDGTQTAILHFEKL